MAANPENPGNTNLLPIDMVWFYNAGGGIGFSGIFLWRQRL
jgi:hypothetical protein